MNTLQKIFGVLTVACLSIAIWAGKIGIDFIMDQLEYMGLSLGYVSTMLLIPVIAIAMALCAIIALAVFLNIINVDIDKTALRPIVKFMIDDNWSCLIVVVIIFIIAITASLHILLGA